eukprot:1344218-Prymnesium_polylepis.1
MCTFGQCAWRVSCTTLARYAVVPTPQRRADAPSIIPTSSGRKGGQGRRAPGALPVGACPPNGVACVCGHHRHAGVSLEALA